ncbi:TlpA disulfide reductase family protein [Dyadobacter luticola]|uniref:TlpA family protein disulfide reductase n=1 Tax=Dyadobacter luticola TaxID=1979387 RepID=A0A5R9KYG7_9BACT|nr:TlpA disulfide reductase family protein [Dyadobacter luticola]TLV01356.1 TlpA family protein disulfide reductase [Dyadobacter luticola]
MVGYQKWLFVLILFCLGHIAYPQQIRVIKYLELREILDKPGDSTLVVNFWATWCLPCVTELPHFEKISAQYAKKKVKVLLVSLDAASLLKKKVEPFVVRKGIKSAKVVLLNEPDYNSWIDKVSPEWSGALPFTLIIDSKTRKSYERPFTEAELAAELKTFIQ